MFGSFDYFLGPLSHHKANVEDDPVLLGVGRAGHEPYIAILDNNCKRSYESSHDHY